MIETLYKSPIIIVDDVEWHVACMRSDSGQRKAIVGYYWRRLELCPGKWKAITLFPGQRPRCLWKRMQTFFKHARQAQNADDMRKAAIRRLLDDPGYRSTLTKSAATRAKHQSRDYPAEAIAAT